MKKAAKRKSKRTARRLSKSSAKSAVRKSIKQSPKGKTKTKKKHDIVKVRENIDNLVKASARDIANEVIKVAKTGQLASAKYLFEAVGLYPPTEETMAKPKHDTLAQTLLTRLGLPLEPVNCNEDSEPTVLGHEVQSKDKTISDTRSADENAQEGGEARDEAVAAQGGE